MNKPLSAGILFILSLVLLYLGGVSKGAIGAGLAVGGLICFIAAIISGIKSITSRGRKGKVISTESGGSEPTASSSNKYSRLEKKKGWRVAKVGYWLVIVFIVILSLFHVDYYGNSDIQGLALFAVLICFPMYLLYRKVAYYIVSGE